MAVIGYEEVNLAAGVCVDPEQHVIPIVKNVVALFNDFNKTGSNVFCQPVVDCEATVYTESSLGCCELDPIDVDTTPFSADSLSSDKRIFMLQQSISASFIRNGDEGGQDPTSTVKIEIYCEDSTEEVLLYQTQYLRRGQLPDQIYFEAICPRTAKIKLCIRHRLIGKDGFTFFTTTATANFCGAILSIREGVSSSSTALESFYCPGEMDPTCRQGKEAMYMANQNANAMCRAYAEEGGQSFRKVEVNQSGDGEVVVQQGIEAGTIWVTQGIITVCYRRTGQGEATTVSVTPRIGCESGVVTCGTKTYGLPRDQEFASGEGAIICRNISFIACGTCKEGDTLTVNSAQEIVCDGRSSLYAASGINAEIVSIDTSACTFLFEQAATSSLPAPTTFRLWDCLSVTPFLLLLAKIRDLHTFACNRTPINCNTETGVTAYMGEVIELIAAAQTWPPAAPLPRPIPDPPPVKCRVFNISACIRYTGDLNGFSQQILKGRAKFEILCGGAVVGETETVNWAIGYRSPFDSDNDYPTNAFGGCVSFNGCIDCPIDQDVEVRFIGETANTVNGAYTVSNLIGTTDANVFALCF